MGIKHPLTRGEKNSSIMDEEQVIMKTQRNMIDNDYKMADNTATNSIYSNNIRSHGN